MLEQKNSEYNIGREGMKTVNKILRKMEDRLTSSKV